MSLAGNPKATHAQVELILAALPRVRLRDESRVTQEIATRMLAEAQAFLEHSEGKMGPLTAGLRMLKGLRPAWLTVPVYAELLSPFSDLCIDVLGHHPSQLLAAAAALEEAPPGERSLPADIPLLLLERIAIRLDQIEGPADLHDRVLVQIDDTFSYALRYKAVEVVYRAIIAILGQENRHFTRKRGQSLERFVEGRLKAIAPAWTILRGEHLAGREKDIIAWDDDWGIAIECKSLRLRPHSSGWSKLNLESDVTVIETAISQVGESLAAMRAGAITDAGRRAPCRSSVQGIVVSDEPFSPFIRAGLDRLPFGSDEARWHGEDTWVCSAVDFHYLCSKATSVSVLLHYLTHYRKSVWMRVQDEPEAWSAYCAAQTHLMATAGVMTTIIEHDWERERSSWPDAFRPQWLARSALVRTFDERRSSAKGLRIVQQDLDRAVRTSRRQLNQRRGTDNDEWDEETMETIRQMVERRHEAPPASRPEHL